MRKLNKKGPRQFWLLGWVGLFKDQPG